MIQGTWMLIQPEPPGMLAGLHQRNEEWIRRGQSLVEHAR